MKWSLNLRTCWPVLRQVFVSCVVLLVLSSIPAAAQLVDDLIDAPLTLEPSSRTVTGKRFSERSISSPIFHEFTGVAVQVVSLSNNIEMDIRIEEDGVWREWRPPQVVPSATGGTFVGGFHGTEVFKNTRIEVRIRGDSDFSVEIVGIGTFDNRANPDGAESLIGVVPVYGKSTGNIIPPNLITRADWNAEGFRGTPSVLANPDFRYMTFHHAAGYSAETLEEGIAQVYAIQDLHQNVRGWSDIGYQFVIDRGGRLYQGRPFLDGSTSLAQVPVLAMGAHVGGANSGNIGVSILGCYHPPAGTHCEQELTPAALDTYTTLFAFLSERYGIEPTLIRGHRDFSSTACPGNNNYTLIPALITSVEELLITGNQSLGAAELSSSIDDDGIVHLSWITTEDFGILKYRLERDYKGIKEFIYTGTDSAGSKEDSGISDDGLVTYNLYAIGEGSREQRISSLEVNVEFTNVYALTQVYPNPANRTATFRYRLKHDGFVTLRVYDVVGRQIVSRSEGYQKSERWFNTDLDVSGFARGVYYYQIEVEGFTEIDFEENRSFVVMR